MGKGIPCDAAGTDGVGKWRPGGRRTARLDQAPPRRGLRRGLDNPWISAGSTPFSEGECRTQPSAKTGQTPPRQQGRGLYRDRLDCHFGIRIPIASKGRPGHYAPRRIRSDSLDRSIALHPRTLPPVNTCVPPRLGPGGSYWKDTPFRLARAWLRFCAMLLTTVSWEIGCICRPACQRSFRRVPSSYWIPIHGGTTTG